jgi:hypothetical protein
MNVTDEPTFFFKMACVRNIKKTLWPLCIGLLEVSQWTDSNRCYSFVI